jgi:hypothetical protein
MVRKVPLLLDIGTLFQMLVLPPGTRKAFS